MAKVTPYHTNETEYDSEHRNVYHDHDDCRYGKRIKSEHRVRGSDAKPLCRECMRLDGALPSPY